MSYAGWIMAACPALLAIAGAVACQPDPPPYRGSTGANSATATAATAASTVDLDLRERYIAQPLSLINNISAQIRTLTKLLAKAPDNFKHRSALVDKLLARGAHVGNIADLSRAAELAEKAVELAPEKHAAYSLRARGRAALHRFDEALADLDKALELGADRKAVDKQRGSILTGLGRYDEALTLLHAATERRPETASLVVEAITLGKMGRIEEADKLFIRADHEYKGVSAMAVAWIYFNRGSMWHTQGDVDKAKALYSEAVLMFPALAHAVGHLAPMVAPRRAVSMLETVMERSDDPEYVAVLSRVREKMKKGDGAELLEKAKAGYKALIDKHPEAFADHAGWFWLVIAGDPVEALRMAEINLKTRPTPDAYELLIAALAANGKSADACKRADEALARPYASPGLKHAAKKAHEACTKKPK